MSEAIQSYPLQWPVGWRRTEAAARINRARDQGLEALS